MITVIKIMSQLEFNENKSPRLKEVTNVNNGETTEKNITSKNIKHSNFQNASECANKRSEFEIKDNDIEVSYSTLKRGKELLKPHNQDPKPVYQISQRRQSKNASESSISSPIQHDKSKLKEMKEISKTVDEVQRWEWN